jgi:hypothetical protein
MTFENFNLYGTGGVAFGGFNATVNCGTGLCAQNGIPMAETSSSTVRVGGYGGIGFTTGVGTSTWATAIGAGAESSAIPITDRGPSPRAIP